MSQIPFTTIDLSLVVEKIIQLDNLPAVSLLSEQVITQGPDAIGTDDITKVTSSLLVYTDTLRSIYSSISRAQSLVDALRKEADAVENKILRCRYLISPIRRLPLELLQGIFVLSHLGSDRATHGRLPAVCQVSQLWRNISLSTPQLWGTVTVKLDSSTPRHVPCRILESLLAWTDPLPVSIRAQEAVFRHTDKSAAHFARLVAAYSRRVQSLSMDITGSRLISLLNIWKTGCAPFKLPNLQSLHLHKSAFPTVTAHALIYLCPNAPNLSNLSLPYAPDNIAQVPEFVFLSISETLKAFRGTLSENDVISLFSFCRRLEVLVLGFPHLSAPPLQYPRFDFLSSLCLKLPTSNDFTLQVTSFPPFPALRHLAIYQAKYSRATIDIVPLLEKWGGRLRYLGLLLIRRPTEGWETILPLLDLAPDLECIMLPTHFFPMLTSTTYSFPRHLAHMELCPDVHGFRSDARREVEDGLDRMTDLDHDAPLNRLHTLTVMHDPEDPEDEQWLPTVRSRLSELGVSATLATHGRAFRSLAQAECFDTPYFQRQGGIFHTLHAERRVRY